MTQKQHTVVIVGGGFAGVKCALTLQKKCADKITREKLRVILISDRPHFEYHGALYRLVSGHSPLEVCLPLREILDENKIEILEDRITKIDTKTQKLFGTDGQDYDYDSLVIGLGSQTVYFNVPGLEEHAHGIKSISAALALKNHIHKTIDECVNGTKEQKVCGGNFVVIGGGATGVETAAELAHHTKKLAKKHGLDPVLMHVELIEGQSRILPTLPEKFARRIEKKMRSIGVNIFTNRMVTKGEVESVHMKDMQLKTKTIVWTAGVRGNTLIEEAGLATDKTGRAIVCKHLRAQNHNNIYAAGDAAATEMSGMAQTALQDGVYIAETIERTLNGKAPENYTPRRPIYAVPVGPGWAGAMFGGLTCYGKFGWAVRRLVDMVVFVSFLPPSKAWHAFSAHRRISQTCPTCCALET